MDALESYLVEDGHKMPNNHMQLMRTRGYKMALNIFDMQIDYIAGEWSKLVCITDVDVSG